MFADDYELIDRIAVALIRRRERIGTAESCTGGLIAAACTSLSGSSDWFERGAEIGWAQGLGILIDDFVAAGCTLVVIALYRVLLG